MPPVIPSTLCLQRNRTSACVIAPNRLITGVPVASNGGGGVQLQLEGTIERTNSLPELGDGGGEVGGVGGQPESFVLADRVLDAAVGVPRLIAFGPRQLGLETLQRQKEQRV